jgi:glycosyltransferase 2 family protein
MRKHLRTLLGVSLSLLLLAWVLRDVSPAEVWHETRQADPVLFGVSILLALVGFGFRALRWGILLVPVEPGLAYRPRFAATMIGFAANNVLPARVGEFARAFSLTRLTRVPLGSSLATLMIERVFDAIVVIGLLVLVMAGPAFPVDATVAGLDLQAVVRLIALAVGVGIVFLFGLVLAPGPFVRAAEWTAQRLPTRLQRPMLSLMHAFLAGLGSLRSPRLFLASLCWAAAQWLVTGVSFLLAFRAFGIVEVGFAGALFLQSLIALAVAIPSSPGFFGPFEAAARVGLALWAVAPEKAVSFAIGYHIGGFLPVTLIGIYYVWRLDLSWRQVRHSEEEVEAEARAEKAEEPWPAAVREPG